MDMVRVLRIIEYVGPRDVVEKRLARSLRGSNIFGRIAITVTTLGEFPEIMKHADLLLHGSAPKEGSTVEAAVHLENESHPLVWGTKF